MVQDQTQQRIIARVQQLKKYRDTTSDILRKVELTNRIHNLKTMILLNQNKISSS